MKKNRMMRLASGLLVLTLLTTCMISGTFAKYVTKDTGQDTARVAKWGVTLDVKSDLFADAYKETSVEYTATNATVKAEAAKTNVVAPGTNGIGLEIKNTATSEPEVSYEMKIKLDDTNAAMPSLKYTPTGGNATTYEPVVFNVYNGDTKLNTTALSLDGLKTLFNGTKVIYKYDVASGKYIVDSNLDGTLGETATSDKPIIKVEWVWAYETGADADAKALNDKLDTILGDLASGTSTFTDLPATIGSVDTTNSKIDVSLNWTVTATQID